jgi:hypothetical protein
MPMLYNIQDINKEMLLKALYALAVASQRNNNNPINLTSLQSPPHSNFNITTIDLGLGEQQLSVNLNGNNADFEAYLRSQPSVTLPQITTILRKLRPPDVVPLPPRIGKHPLNLQKYGYREYEASPNARDRVSKAYY